MPFALVLSLSILVAGLQAEAAPPEPAEPSEPPAQPATQPLPPLAPVPTTTTTEPVPISRGAAPADEKQPLTPSPNLLGEKPSPGPGEAPPAPVEEGLEPTNEDVTGPGCPAHTVCVHNDVVAVWPRFRLRAGYENVQADRALINVGQNDGFFLNQARLGIEGVYLDFLRFRLVFDAVSFAGSGNGATATHPVETILGAARDAYVAWTPSPFFRATLGQQFMPTDAEGSMTIAANNFARRSIAVSGVLPGHGVAVQGLSPSRQIGLVVGSDDDANIGSLHIDYALAVSNGNGQNVLGNDNKLPAVYARVGVGFEELVRLGGGASWNPRTVGAAPNLFDESDGTVFGDLRVRGFGVDLLGQVIWRKTSFDTVVPFATRTASASQDALGVTAWIVLDEPLGFDLLGIKPGYRFSYYDPSNAFPDDQLFENSISLRWDAPIEIPVSLIADYTFLTETGAGVRDLDNNRFTERQCAPLP